MSVNPLAISPHGGSRNGTADGLSNRKPQVTVNIRPINHSILLPPDNKGILKTLDGETKWKIIEIKKEKKIRVKDVGSWKNGKIFLDMNN